LALRRARNIPSVDYVISPTAASKLEIAMKNYDMRAIKSWHTRAKQARSNAAAARRAAAIPENLAMRAFLLKAAEKDEAVARTAELRAEARVAEVDRFRSDHDRQLRTSGLPRDA
jgi:hypothetical protein